MTAGVIGFYTTYLSQNHSTYQTMQFSNVLYVFLCLLFSILWIDSVSTGLTYWPTTILMVFVYSCLGACDAVGVIKANALLLKIKDRAENLYFATQAVAYACFSFGPAAGVYMSTSIYTYSGGKAWIPWLVLAGLSLIEIAVTQHLPATEFKEPDGAKVALPTFSRIVPFFPAKYWVAALIVLITLSVYGLYQVGYFLFAEGASSSLHERGWDAIFSAEVMVLFSVVEVVGFFVFSFYAKEWFFGTFGKGGGIVANSLLFVLYCVFLGTVILADAPTGWVVAGFCGIVIFAAQAATVEMLLAMVSDDGDEGDDGALERKGTEAVEAFFAIFNFEIQGSYFIGSVCSGLLYNYLGYGGLLLVLGGLVLGMTAYFWHYYIRENSGKGRDRGNMPDKTAVPGASDGDSGADGSGGVADERTSLIGTA